VRSRLPDLDWDVLGCLKNKIYYSPCSDDGASCVLSVSKEPKIIELYVEVNDQLFSKS
jgi:hypothetical protein